jgi:hypothetical protein
LCSAHSTSAKPAGSDWTILAVKMLATTRASGENRSTLIENFARDDGQIVLQGVGQGRAFSVCLEAKKYMVKY